jgi:tRNA A-37 threonylcarbamoyl transferase component Bud32
MNQVKDTARATVRLGYDGRVHKTFRGPHAEDRFANEVRVLQYLEKRECSFVPRLLDHDPAQLVMVTTNCGGRVDRMDDVRVAQLFAELEAFGVSHEDRHLRNITYSPQLGRFCLIDFEFATILDENEAESMNPKPPVMKTADGFGNAPDPIPAATAPSAPSAVITDHR